MIQRLLAAMSAGGTVEHVQRVRVRVAQREHLRLGRHDQVDRVDRQMLGHPTHARDDARVDVAVVPADLPRDQREQPLGVGLPVHQRAVIAELLLQPRQAGEHAVVGEQAPVLLEGVGVRERQRARRGEAHVRQERARALAARLAREGGVGKGRDRRLVDDRPPLRVEDPQARPVGVAPALRGEAVGRIQQPQLRAHRLGPTAHREQPAHQRPCTTSALASTSSMFAYPLNAIARSRSARKPRSTSATPSAPPSANPQM